MPEPTQNPVAEQYTARDRRFSAEAESLGKRSRLISNLRGVSFGVLVIAGLFAMFGSTRVVPGVLSLVGGVAFLVLVIVHARVIEREDEKRRYARVNRDALARCTGRFRELPENGARFADAAHPYADDLDVFGPGSLFQRVCVAHTRFGQAALARHFAEPATLKDVQERQEAVRALAPELETRQRFEAHALAAVDAPVSENKRALRAAPDPEPLLAWAEGEPGLSASPAVVWAARLLPPITLAGFVASLGFGLPSLCWAIPLTLQILVNLRTRAETWRVFSAVSSTEGAFLRYGAMLEILENLQLPSKLLGDMRERVSAGGHKPSESMNEFRRGVGWFDLRHNGLVHPFANALLLWDVHCSLKLEAWRRRSGRNVRSWFSCLGELEALSSLAGLAHDEPQFAFPEVVEDQAIFEATELGHPLIDSSHRVPNDVSLPHAGTAMLVTGSNMSGKSTLLRAMGLAAVMAMAGAPVCAKRLRVSRFAVRTSIRVSDSLERGVSHFYAELRKLKAVMDATAGDLPVFFLLDEILHGTNSRERQIGARWVLGELLEQGATGAVSTHDMELCRLPEALMERVRQVHFRESVENDKMTFDYRLRPGSVSEGNALRLMRIVGLSVPLE